MAQGEPALISIIIPVLNEERALPDTLTRVYQQNAENEIIVVDGGSTDNTISIVKSDPQIKLITAAQGRGSQMNVGAAMANGEWLLFLHADTLLPDNALSLIESLPTTVNTGGFKHKFSGHAWGLKLISRLHNYRCRISKIFYGDQAMFIRKDLFNQLGGFPEQHMEDVIFGETLAKITHPEILDAYVITDSRKFEQSGIWLSLWRVILILISYELKLPLAAKQFFSNIR